jgi:hypothetical protein
VLLTSSFISEEADPSTISNHSLSAIKIKSRLLTSQPPTLEFVRGPHVLSSCFPDVAPLSCFILWSRFQLSCQVPYQYALCTVQGWHSESTTLWQRPTSAKTHHHHESGSSALHSTLQPNTGPHISPLIHFTILATPGKPV